MRSTRATLAEGIHVNGAHYTVPALFVADGLDGLPVMMHRLHKPYNPQDPISATIPGVLRVFQDDKHRRYHSCILKPLFTTIAWEGAARLQSPCP